MNFNSIYSQVYEQGNLKGSIRANVPGLFIRKGAAVDVSATDAVFTEPCFLYVTGEGNVVVDLVDGGTGLTFAVDDASYFFGLVTKVHTASTATGIIACWG